MKNNEAHPSCSCVMKLWFGKRYFIWKSKALHQSLKSISKEIDQRLRIGQKPDDIYDGVIKYIRRANVNKFEAEVVFKSDNPQELLVQEYKLLQVGKGDDSCLNVKFEPLMPKWIPDIDKKAFLSIKNGLQVGQVITPARGAGGFRVKTLKKATTDADTTSTQGA